MKNKNLVCIRVPWHKAKLPHFAQQQGIKDDVKRKMWFFKFLFIIHVCVYKTTMNRKLKNCVLLFTSSFIPLNDPIHHLHVWQRYTWLLIYLLQRNLASYIIEEKWLQNSMTLHILNKLFDKLFLWKVQEIERKIHIAFAWDGQFVVGGQTCKVFRT